MSSYLKLEVMICFTIHSWAFTKMYRVWDKIFMGGFPLCSDLP